jgi:hypothetical protein
MTFEQSYRTIDIERRGYGRRYTWLPVDQLSRDAFMIDCTSTYTRAEMILYAGVKVSSMFKAG